MKTVTGLENLAKAEWLKESGLLGLGERKLRGNMENCFQMEL